MITETLTILYFFVPAYIANIVPVFFRKLKFFNYPLDFGATLRGKRLFGNHKTWRGMIFGVLLAMLAFYVQQLAYYNGFTSYALFPYDQLHVLIGAALGFGALLGDAFESTIKRQLGIRDGGRFLFWDQIDFLIGAGVVALAFWLPAWKGYLLTLIIVFILTLLVQRIGYWLKLKNDPW